MANALITFNPKTGEIDMGACCQVCGEPVIEDKAVNYGTASDEELANAEVIYYTIDTEELFECRWFHADCWHKQ